MKTQHTKGEWGSNVNELFDFSKSIEVWGFRQSQERVIARLPIHDKWERENDDPSGWKKNAYPEQIANAKLIAAAPDLLKALMAAKEEFQGTIEMSEIGSENPTWKKMLAAIKKATE